EMAVPVRSDLFVEVGDLGRRTRSCWQRGQESRRSELRAAARALPAAGDLLAIPRQRLDSAGASLPRCLKANTHAHFRRFTAERASRALVTLLQRLDARVENSGKLLSALSYRGVLARGFALVRDEAGHPLHAADAIGPGARVEIEFADGRVGATADADRPAAA